MTEQEFDILADEYDEQTNFHSLANMMVRTPAFKRLIEAGEQIVPWIIEAFERYDAELRKRGEQFGPGWHWGMNWVLLLESITHERPLEPVVEDGFAKWDVHATCRSWITWANKSHKVPEFRQLR